MSDRFFVESPIDSDTVELEGTEAHHLLHVMRAKPGAVVTLFDGTGQEYSARMVATTRRRAELQVLSRSSVDRELQQELVLGVALPKGDRQSWLVEKSVELGVRKLVPLHTARSVVRPAATTLKRLRRTVVESSKQCGRNRLMQIDPPQSLPDFLCHAPGDALRWIAHPAVDAATEQGIGQAARGLSSRRPLFIAVGPEGGFESDEIALAIRAGWVLIGLGPRVLRVETAAIALASAVMWNDQGEFSPLKP
jgi:16S rRNA (uracil1498-N3)-methyltransferase